MTVALVTGVTGFIGRHLTKALQSNGIEVAGVSRDKAQTSILENMHIGDINDRVFVSGLIRQIKPDLIFHLAANKSRTGDISEFRRSLEDNLFGTLNLVEACVVGGQIQRFVSVGTCEEYGDAGSTFSEEMRESPVSAYSLSKASASHLLQTIYRTNNLPIVVLRPSLAYGPGQSTDMFLPALIETLLSGNRFAMSKGEQTRDYVYIDDLIEGLLLASTEPDAIGKIINLSSGAPVSLNEIAELAAGKISVNAVDLLDIGKVGYRANEIMEYSVSNGLAEKLLGWRPRTPLEDGLTTTVAHHQEIRSID